MGFDLHGEEPISEVGKYFRNNVWWWHPLWEYCQITYPQICDKVLYGHSNDGDGLKAEDAKALALLLRKDISSGKVLRYSNKREKRLKLLPSEECVHCLGSGIRNDEYVKGDCNACSASGKTRPFECNYYFTVENVIEFYNFVIDSGGFSIC